MTDNKLKRYGLIITIILVLSAAANMIYASYQVIPQPLFTAINRETIYGENFDETLYVSYITNNNDKRRLESISFQGLESPQLVSQTLHFNSFDFGKDLTDNPYNDNIGRYYTLKRGYVDLQLTEADIKTIEENGSLTFESGIVNYDDGTSMPVFFGRIVILSKDNWNNHRLREGAGGSDDYLNVDFKTDKPIQITSIDLSSFEKHQDAIDMELIVDQDKVYTYDDLKTKSESISVDKSFQVAFTAKDEDVSCQWRFNMIAMDLTYDKEGQRNETWIYSPFYGTGMDDASVEAYVDLWRTENE